MNVWGDECLKIGRGWWMSEVMNVGVMNVGQSFVASMTGARQGWGSSHGLDEIEDCREACRLTYMEEELPLVFLITFLLLLLSVPLVFGNHLHKEPSQQWGRGWEGEELSKYDILFIENVTKFGEKSFTKKGENFSESTKTVLNLNL